MTKNNLSKILLSFISFFVLSFLVLGRSISSIGSIGNTTENSSVIYDGENSYSSVEEYQRANKQSTVTKQNSSNNNVEPLTTVNTDHETEHPGEGWTVLNGQTSLSSGNYYLESDISSTTITIVSGSDVSLCLAGYTLTSSSRNIIQITNSSSGSETSFTLYDCSENEEGLITTSAQNSIYARYGIYASNEASNTSLSITINGGTINSVTSNSYYSNYGLYAINSADNSSLSITINGGTISSTSASTTSSYAFYVVNEGSYSFVTITMNGGTISSVNSVDGASRGFYFSDSSSDASISITINGGIISASSTSAGASYGFGVSSTPETYDHSYAFVTINGGEIISTSTDVTGYPRGLTVDGPCISLTINAGTISVFSYDNTGQCTGLYLSAGGSHDDPIKQYDTPALVTINGGTIYAYADDISARAVYIRAAFHDIDVTINDGSFIAFSDSSTYESTGIECYSYYYYSSLITLTVNGGTITLLDPYETYNTYGYYFYETQTGFISATINGGTVTGACYIFYLFVSPDSPVSAVTLNVNGGNFLADNYYVTAIEGRVYNGAILTININGGYFSTTEMIITLTNGGSCNITVNAGYFTESAYTNLWSYFVPDTSIMINFDESELDASLDPYYTSDYPYAVYVKGDTYQYILDGTTICYDGTTYYQDYLEELLGDKVTYSYTDGTNTVDNALPTEVGNYSVTARFNEPRINYEVTPKEYYEGAITFNLNIVNHDYNSGSYQSDDTQHWSQCVNSLNGGICHEDTYYEEHEFSGWVESSELEDTEESACTICGYTRTRSAGEGSTDPDDPNNPDDPDNPGVSTDPDDPNNPDDPTNPENPSDPDDPDDPGVSTDPNDQDNPDNPTGTGQGGETPGTGSIDSTASTLFILHIVYITIAVICLIAGYIAKRNADKDNELEAENNDATA